MVTGKGVRGKRQKLIEAFGHEGRKVGSMSLILNHLVADRLGVSQREWEVIDILDWTGPITAGRLAELMSVTTGAVTGVVDRLAEKGMVTRKRDPEDRRKVIIDLRREKLEPVGEQYHPLIEGMTRLVNSMSTAELESVSIFMRRFNDTLEEAISKMGKSEA